MTVQLSSSQMQPTIRLLVMEGTKLGSSLVPEAAFGGSILYGSSPFCAANMISLSSPVACSSSVGTPPIRRKVNYVNWNHAMNTWSFGGFPSYPFSDSQNCSGFPLQARKLGFRLLSKIWSMRVYWLEVGKEPEGRSSTFSSQQPLSPKVTRHLPVRAL